MKTMANKILSLAFALLVACPMMQAQEMKNDLVGTWECESMQLKGTQNKQKYPQKYYKFIAENYFLMVDIPEYFPEVKEYQFTGKYGDCKRISDNILMEGYDNVTTYKEDGKMFVEWGSPNVTVETWVKAEPLTQVKSFIKLVSEAPGGTHPFVGIWKLKKIYYVEDGERYHQNAQEQYIMMNEDTYLSFTLGREVVGAMSFSCSVNPFEFKTANALNQNNPEGQSIKWAEDKLSFDLNIEDQLNGKPITVVFEWVKTDFPELFKKSIEAVK